MSFLKPDSSIEYIKGVGPAKAELLRKELQISTVEQLLFHFPFRYIDRTQFNKVKDLNADGEWVFLKLRIIKLTEQGSRKFKVLVIKASDDTGNIDLVWFRSHAWVKDKLIPGKEFLVFGKVQNQAYGLSLPHPEVEALDNLNEIESKQKFIPVYSTTEKLIQKGLNSRAIARITEQLVQNFIFEDIQENLPPYIIDKYRLESRNTSLKNIHSPNTLQQIESAQNRFKFEELFKFQLNLAYNKSKRKNFQQGFLWNSAGESFTNFYNHLLPFQLTNAQKRVIKEIHTDLRSGKQMNRLLQGDVGSGKTIVALLIMLIAHGNGYQSCLMAPTEILAKQHFQGLNELLSNTTIKINILTGSIKGKERNKILEDLQAGTLNILVGTHAVIEDSVQFNNLGLVVIDEQHRFGVEQRAKLWAKSKQLMPHVLIMSATPIPRTLAMTQYGDLDVSIIDELPPGRKDIITRHIKDRHRMDLYKFMKEEIQSSRQVYIVYPLIEESEVLDIENLQLGYEKLLEYFPLPQYQISVVHGKLKPADKEMEMKRFVDGRSNIMVATTVIEVGVNVPNATVMVIENAERFGLSQLHQLRGRVGRGSDQSYCILMSADHIGRDSQARMKIMCETQDGFKIAEEDLRLRGPGDLSGTKQSGLYELAIADIKSDEAILLAANKLANIIIEKDPLLDQPVNQLLKKFVMQSSRKIELGRIS
ncbi:MAG: ATP-dependent DNA helicase RecG [Saprospiraceae bacterium]|nr:ATP-dependent DNA helicase RecG [Saprospiraceae bacterium]